jgi:hypothetical protein
MLFGSVTVVPRGGPGAGPGRPMGAPPVVISSCGGDSMTRAVTRFRSPAGLFGETLEIVRGSLFAQAGASARSTAVSLYGPGRQRSWGRDRCGEVPGVTPRGGRPWG